MKQRKPRRRLPEKDRATILVPIRLTPKENEDLLKYVESIGEFFVSRVIKKVLFKEMGKSRKNVKAQVS